MLALCRAHGWDSRAYRLADHPVQRAMQTEVAPAADVSEDDLETAVDGCGVVTFAFPLERMARAFARLERLDGGDRVAAAMRAHPGLIRGPGGTDTVLMRARRGLDREGRRRGADVRRRPAGTRGRAEGRGRRVARRRPGARRLPRPPGPPVEKLERVPLTNSRGEVVGEIRAV